MNQRDVKPGRTISRKSSEIDIVTQSAVRGRSTTQFVEQEMGNEVTNGRQFSHTAFPFDKIVSCLPFSVIVVDPEGYVVHANAAAEVMFNASFREDEKTRCGDFVSCAVRKIHSRGCGHSQHCIECPLWYAIRTVTGSGQETAFSGEIETVRDEGLRPLFLRYHCQQISFGDAVFALTTIEDITERKIREKKLKESDDRFRSLANSGLALIWTLNVSMHGDFFNRKWQEFTGLIYPEGRGSKDNWLEVVHEKDRLTMWPVWQEKMMQRLDFTMEFRARRHDGACRSIEAYACARYDEDGDFNGYIFQGFDITEKKELEEQVETSRQKSRNILDSLDAHIAVVGEDSIILDVNAAWEKFAVKNHASTTCRWGVGSRYFREVPPNSPDYHAAQQAYQGILSVQRGEAAQFMQEYDCSFQGNSLWFLMKVLPLSGFPGKVIISHTDITYHKIALVQMEESEERFRTFFEEAPDAIFLAGFDDRIMDANPAATRMLGYSREEFLAMSLPEVQAPEVRGEKGTVLKNELMRDGCLEGIDLHKNGSRVPVEIHNQIIQREGRQLVLSIVRDFTERKKIEEELLQSKKMYQDLFENLPVGAYQSSLDGKILAANPVCLEIARWPASEYDLWLQQDTRQSYVNPADAETLRKLLLEHGEVKGYVAPIHRRDGTTCWLSNTARLIRDEAGQPLHISGSFLDITENRETAMALKEESERNDALLKALPDMLFLFSKDGVFLDVHVGKHRDLLAPPEEILGHKISDIMSGEISALTLAAIGEVMDHGRHKDYHYTLHIQGTLQYFEARMVPFGADKVLCIVRNVTQRKKAEAESELLMSAVRQVEEAIVITDAEGLIKFANPAFEEVSGYSLEEVIGKQPGFLKSGQHDEAFYEDMWRTISRGNGWKGKITNRKKDGSLFIEEMTISPVFDKSHQIVNYVAVKNDVTDALELERQLRHVQKVESIGRLAGGIAHDLNNLLSPIFGYNELLLDELSGDDPRRDLVNGVLTAANGAKELVRKLLAFSRKQTLRYDPVNLNTILTEFNKLLHRTIPEHIQIKSCLADNLKLTLADAGQIEQVIMNLAVNAADAMPKGGKLTFSTENVLHDDLDSSRPHWCKPGEYVVLKVNDTGCGMDRKTTELIFEPFFSTKGERGNGLGLATVYGITRQHGGGITVTSQPGEGSAFSVYLPAMASAEQGTVDEKKEAENFQGTETVLLVEDDDRVRQLVEMMLKRLGYNVILAENGEALLGKLDSIDEAVDLLLTDVIMPGMNGGELYEAVKVKYPDIRVLFISGYSGDIIENMGIFERGGELLEKPFSRQALALKIREVLRGEIGA